MSANEVGNFRSIVLFLNVINLIDLANIDLESWMEVNQKNPNCEGQILYKGIIYIIAIHYEEGFNYYIIEIMVYCG